MGTLCLSCLLLSEMWEVAIKLGNNEGESLTEGKPVPCLWVLREELCVRSVSLLRL